MKNTAKLIAGVLLAAFTLGAVAQDSPHYKDGPVTYVSYIKTKSGKFDDYVAFLDTQYKALMTANKKAGLILDFKVFSASPRRPGEPDVILSVTYPNMAALDRSDEADAVSNKVIGNSAVQSKQFADRDAMREVLGGELIREMILK
jgi:hypothetical protein